MPTEMLQSTMESYTAAQIDMAKAPQPALPNVPFPPAPTAHRPAPSTVVQTSAEHELEAYLQRDPNTGAVHGLRLALLFNAGLALTGLLAWELWSMLAL